MRVFAPLAELSTRNEVTSMTVTLGSNLNAKSAESKVFFKKDLYIKKRKR
jgi:hypothetical protein